MEFTRLGYGHWPHHRIGKVTVTPKSLVAAFGKPDQCDGYKVSGIYCFEGKIGDRVIHVVVYDYKRTHLYDKRLPRVDNFWASSESCEFSIGGLNEADSAMFIPWLNAQL